MKRKMSESPQSIQVESIHLRDVAEALPRTRLFAETPFSEIGGIDLVDRVTAKAGARARRSRRAVEVTTGSSSRAKPAPSAPSRMDPGPWWALRSAGEGFGETPLLTCRTASMFRISAVQDSVLLRFSEQDFWSLLACCPAVRKDRPRRQRATPADLSGRGAAPRKTRLPGHARRRSHARAQQSRLSRQARRIAAPRKPAAPAGDQPPRQRETQNA